MDLDLNAKEFGLDNYEVLILNGFELSLHVKQVPTLSSMLIECTCDTLVVKEFSQKYKIDFIWLFSLYKQMAQKRRSSLEQ